MIKEAAFQDITPDSIIKHVEDHLGITLDGVLTPYNSYINRVYGLQDEDGARYIVKFYRPGRWTKESILEEHRFLFQCEENEIPVIPPIVPEGCGSLGETTGKICFALFPLRAGRTFDIAGDRDWVRLGSIIGRMHQVGRQETAEHRVLCSPETTTEKQIEKLLSGGLVHPDCAGDFENICREILNEISPLFQETANQRIHGDCHRGNILDRMEEGLLLIDFDDMMTGPPVQDLWLLLPGHVQDCITEMDLLLHGYTQFEEFDTRTLNLIEPLRFMRIIHFLAWVAMQREDRAFRQNHPDWGTEAFWIKEIEDLRYQQTMIRETLSGPPLPTER